MRKSLQIEFPFLSKQNTHRLTDHPREDPLASPSSQTKDRETCPEESPTSYPGGYNTFHRMEEQIEKEPIGTGIPILSEDPGCLENWNWTKETGWLFGMAKLSFAIVLL